MPFWDAQWVAPDTKALLFEQPKSDHVLRTYLVVDPGIRKQIIGYADLDTFGLDLPVRCLVKESENNGMAENAPYLIDMTILADTNNDNQSIPRFHRDFFTKHWGKSTGIFLRTTASFDDVWQHLRRFFRVRLESSQQWVIFRFWDPRIAPSYFESIKTEPEKTAQWLTMRNGNRISSILCEQPEADQVWQLVPNWDCIQHNKTAANPTLSALELKGIQQARLYRYNHRAVAFFRKQFPKLAKNMSTEQCQTFIQGCYIKAKQRGIVSEKHHFKYLIIAANWGSGFETDPKRQTALEDLRWSEHQYTNFDSVFTKIDEHAHIVEQDLAAPKRIVLGFERLYSTPKSDMTYNSQDDASIVGILQKIWPNQCKQLDTHSLHEFIRYTGGFAQERFILEGSDLITYIVLAFYFGAEFGHDPLYPWASEALQVKNKEQRRHALGEGVIAHFEAQNILRRATQ